MNTDLESVPPVLQMKNLIHKIIVILSLGTLIGAATGLFNAFRLIRSNQYFHYKMKRIAFLEMRDIWNHSMRTSFEIVGLLILSGIIVSILWRFLFANSVKITNKDKIAAILIGVLGFIIVSWLVHTKFIIKHPYRVSLRPYLALFAACVFFSWIFYKSSFVRNLLQSRILGILAVFLLLLWGGLNIVLALQKSPQKPNVVWIAIDTLRADHLSCYGYGRNTSPKIDEIARKSMQFTHAFSQESYTKASAASYFTSTYPFKNQVMYSYPKIDTLNHRFITLAETLRNEGYATAGFVYNPHFVSLDQGFEIFRTQQKLKKDMFGFDHYETAKQIFSDTKNYLENTKSGPLFLYLHYMDVHAPYAPPDPYDKKYLAAELQVDSRRYQLRSYDFSKEEAPIMMSLYDGEINYTDNSIEQILQLLKQHQIDLSNTILLITSDHGEDFYDAHPGDPGGFEHWRTLYQELIHVPMIISVPGFKAKVIEDRVTLLDIVPTILDLLGYQPEKYRQFEGHSLVPLIRGSSGSHTNTIISGGNRGRIAIIAGDWKYYKYEEQCKQNRFWCHSKPWQGFGTVSFGEELYNLKSDPHETQDLLQANPKIAATMRTLATNAMKKTGFTSGPGSIDMDEKTREELKALGYIEQ